MDTDLVGNVTPRRRCFGDFLDDSSCWCQSQAEIFRRLFEKVDRASAFVEINIRRQDTRFDVRRHRVEVVSWRQRPARPAEPEETVVAQVIIHIGNQHIEGYAPLKSLCVGPRMCAAG